MIGDAHEVRSPDGGVKVVETWFGPAAASLPGYWHLPAAGRARGAVVLCPPLGKEALHAYRMGELAAQQLAERGVAALRFDYRGTGDATGDELEPDAVAQWQADVGTAVQHARDSGADSVALAGLRAGALLAGTAARGCGPLAALALWDPVPAGRGYLREQTVLYRLKVGEDDAADGAVSLVGAALHPDAAAALKRTSLASTDLVDPSTPVLLATREERAGDGVLTALGERTHADHATVRGHEQVFDVATFAVTLPGSSVTEVTGWLADRFPATTTVVDPPVRDSAVVASGAGGVPVRERLARIGPHQLFALVTERDDAADGPLVVTLPSATEHRVGTGRIWVDIARRLAAQGICVVRFDRRGTGDSGWVQVDEWTPTFSAAAHDDLDDVVAALHRPAPRTALIGHCSGAWVAGEAASEGIAGAAVLLGPVRFSIGREIRSWSPADDPDSHEQLLATRAGQARQRVKKVIPGPAWRWLARRDIATAPELALRRLRDAGVRTTMVMAPVDHRHFVRNRGEKGLARLRASGWDADVLAAEQGDHSLVHRGLRLLSIDHAVAAVLRDLGSPQEFA